MTPKGTKPGQATSMAKEAPHHDSNIGKSSRYTPPTPKEYYESPRWVPILMFTLLGVGLGVIFCNYLGLLPALWWDNPPGHYTSNLWLLIGLTSILGGIVTATQYR